MKITAVKTLLLTTLLVIGISANSFACTRTPVKPPVWVTSAHIVSKQFGFWIYIIRIHKLTTFGTKVGSGQVCACALKLPRDIGEIFAAKLVLSDTEIPYPGLSEFVFNKKTGAGFTLLSQGATDWVGFSAKVSQNIDPDVPVDLLFYARIKSDKDEAMKKFEEYIKKNDQPLVATSGADAQGLPVVDKEHPDHTVITAAGEVKIMPPPPECSTYDLETGIFKASDVAVDVLNQKLHFAVEMKTIKQNPFQFELTNVTPK
jgi:hypothetical protein